MSLRHTFLLVALIAAGTACKKDEAPKPVAPAVTHAGSAGSAAATAAVDPWSKPAAPKQPLAHPLFWSVEKDGKTTYFLGTMHLGIDAQARLPDLVWQKLDGARAFAMETDLSDPSLAQSMTSRKDGGTLHQDLGDAYWKKLEDALTPLVAERLDHMKPMVPATLLSMRGLPQTPPMDEILLGHATNEHKPIVFLEKPDKEVVVLEKWMNARALKELLDDLPTVEQHSKDMLAAYAAGDEQKIIALDEEERAEFKKHGHSDKEYEEQMKDLLYNRNASWIEPIEKFHADGGGFIAVGAMHLIGKGSVLDLLQQKGYKVTRITP